jgi:hypothetical protein
MRTSRRSLPGFRLVSAVLGLAVVATLVPQAPAGAAVVPEAVQTLAPEAFEPDAINRTPQRSDDPEQC